MKDLQEQNAASSATVEHHDATPMEASAGDRPQKIITPRASVYETPDSVVLELEMPGVARDAVEVKVENDELTIIGRRTPVADNGYHMLHQERPPFNYRRSFVLSDRIDSTQIKATCREGVLQLVLPKAAKAKPRRIEIQ